MPNMNVAVVCGRVGQDPEIRYTGGGTPVVQLSVATSRWKGKGEQRTEETDWHDVVVFGKTAEYVAERVQKGDTILVRGSIAVRTFERKDKSKGRAVELIADQVELFTRNGNGGAQQASKPAPAASAQRQPEGQGGVRVSDGFDDDIPF